MERREAVSAVLPGPLPALRGEVELTLRLAAKLAFDLLYARYQEPRLVWYCPSTTSDDPVHGGSGLGIALPRAYGILHSGFLHAVILSSHTKVSLYIWFSSP